MEFFYISRKYKSLMQFFPNTKRQIEKQTHTQTHKHTHTHTVLLCGERERGRQIGIIRNLISL